MNRHVIYSLVAACFLLLLAGCRRQETTPMIAVTLDRPEEASATVTQQDGRALIDVTDPRGINGLNATLTGDEWPEEVALLLRHGHRRPRRAAGRQRRRRRDP